MFSAARLNCAGSMRLFTNPPRSVICRPPLQAGEATVVKSPASIAGVGTRAMLAAGCWRTVVPWKAPKKNSLFCTIGPPSVPPNWLRCRPSSTRLAVRSDLRERVRRVEAPVAQELEHIAGDAVGARLGHRVDRGARVHPVLGVEPARRDAELLQRVREGERQVQVVLRVVVHGAVEQVRHAEGLAAGDRDAHAAGHRPVRRLRDLHGRARDHHELDRVPAVERQREDLLVADDVADAGALDVDQRRGPLDGDGLLERADRQRPR